MLEALFFNEEIYNKKRDKHRKAKMDNSKLQQAINKTIAALNELNNCIGEVTAQAKPQVPQRQHKSVEFKTQEKPKPQPKPMQFSEAEIAGGFQKLKEMLNTDKWPEAVNKNLICNPESETDKMERGRGIIELMIEEDIQGLKILDYGCGEGQCINISTEYETELSVGYDIKRYDSWQNYNKSNLVMTNKFEEVANLGPYDIVILFDVLDHVHEADAVDILNDIQKMLKPNGKVYVRCHPFTSRHATHTYHDINKAYLHLVFTPEELKEIIPESKYIEKNFGVTTPLKTYDTWFAQSNLKVVNRREITEKVEPFFKVPIIAERIMKSVKFNQFPEFQMSLQFIDYVLKKRTD